MLTVSDTCKALGIGRITSYRYVRANQRYLRIESACEVPECLREVFDPVVSDEVDLCLRTAGVKRSIKPFAKPRCQMTKPIERERKHIKDNVSPLTVSLHPYRSVLIRVHVCSRVLEAKARQQSSRSVIVSADGREDLLSPIAFLQ